MADFKLVISDPKSGKSYQREVKDPDSSALIGRKIGDTVKGDEFGLAEYEFMITGGSDYCGFPMRKDVSGIARKRILAVKGIGVGKVGKGVRHKKTIAGNTIHPRISQINLKILKEGKAALAPKQEAAA
ncbi:30S ribosomal protein S6e [Candidatus Woesearchaeota archaeon]|nr:30S ribosomal protein S6e [Candidatus Woesearchaeota archaeon]